MSTTKITGFWTFFCNPKYWLVDEFLLSDPTGIVNEYRITSWQRKYFEKGQLGVIRIGVDLRNQSQLNGKKRLEKGVYAIVEIIGNAFPQINSQSDFKIKHQKRESERYIIPIRYIKNYIKNPILFSDIENDFIIKNDSYLLKGIQAASMPLLEDTFNKILFYGEKNSNL